MRDLKGGSMKLKRDGEISIEKNNLIKSIMPTIRSRENVPHRIPDKIIKKERKFRQVSVLVHRMF
ncbi:hypothetical protein KEJ36_04075 [Candidatus Bathyarchaeota archaeon]|nr:hypothetical protein [Candidatus Bathyarchaeota archaeon]MBS7627973.1 hypothetical protein [Candidatus Bathyarchaeota archaeon]